MEINEATIAAVTRKVEQSLGLSADPAEALLTAADRLVEQEGRDAAVDALRQLADELEEMGDEDEEES